MSIHQLIYVSDLVGEEGQLGAILESAVRHNQADDITGMLLYSGGNFLQVLEGAADQVKSTYDRISLDPRHKNCLVLLEQDLPERQFGKWSMGCRRLSAEDVAKFPAHAPYFQYGFRRPDFQVKPGEALEMLDLFCAGML
jgi:Sensors of blue-light using FAD